MTNTSAQKGQLCRSNAYLAQLSNYSSGTSVSTATICHESLLPLLHCTSAFPSVKLELAGWAKRGGIRVPPETGGLEDLSWETQLSPTPGQHHGGNPKESQLVRGAGF